MNVAAEFMTTSLLTHLWIMCFYNNFAKLPRKKGNISMSERISVARSVATMIN